MMNEKYSFKDFTGQSFKNEPLSDFFGTIKGSCFSQEFFQDVDIFPDGMTGITFERCNLDNVFIPAGNTVIGGCHRRVKVQNDGHDWILDEQNNPVEPVHKKKFIQEGMSIDPIDIPAQYLRQDTVDGEAYNKEFPNGQPIATSWYKSAPTILSTETITVRSIMRQESYEAMTRANQFGKMKKTPKNMTGIIPIKAGYVILDGEVDHHKVEGEIYKFKDKNGVMY